MVANSDFQLWQDAVNGINASGKHDLSNEEWSALTMLNGSLSSGNFTADENRQCIKLLNDNLIHHENNRILQMHLQNFINLCKRYFYTGTAKPASVPVAVISGNQPLNTRVNTPRKRNIVLQSVIAVSVVLIVGYALARNSEWFSSLFVGGNTSDKGVIINGVKWATRNVDEVGAFAPTGESLGKLYQWNRKKAFPNAWDKNTEGAKLELDDYNPSGEKWEKINDPSPAGWRVPTFDEMLSLLDKDKVSRKFYIQNGAPGILFTDKATGNSLFFPVPNNLDKNNETYIFSTSRYWSNATFARQRDSENSSFSLNFSLPRVGVMSNHLDQITYNVSITYFNEKNQGAYNMRTYLNSIRSVEDIPPASEVLINGVRWATCNVDESGSFVVSSVAKGKLYQWNRKKAWSPTEGMNKRSDWSYPDWNKTYPNGTTWEEANDPSPAGWRAPTKEEIESLLDDNKVSKQRYRIGDGMYGLYDFEGILFTDKATGNLLRLPLTGQISDGRYYSSYGYYWSSAPLIQYGTINERAAYGLRFMDEGNLNGKVVGLNVIEFSSHDRRYGYAIRSVRK